MATLRNIHPGEILQEEFLTPFGISAYRLAKEISIFIKKCSLKSIINILSFINSLCHDKIFLKRWNL